MGASDNRDRLTRNVQSWVALDCPELAANHGAVDHGVQRRKSKQGQKGIRGDRRPAHSSRPATYQAEAGSTVRAGRQPVSRSKWEKNTPTCVGWKWTAVSPEF